jgi:hypothetical protein
MRKQLIACLILVLILSLSGCSESNPTVMSPDVSNDDSFPIILVQDADISNHNLAGIWSLQLNPDFKEANVVLKREAAIHYNVTRMIPAPQIIINGYNPFTRILDVDVTITNPYPIEVYDVRLIIFTDTINTTLLEPDNWTTLFDIPGANIVNPFKAYCKTQQNRIFAHYSQHTENLKIWFPQGIRTVSFAVDVSYPGNCEDPYQIKWFNHGTLKDDTGSSCEASVTVKDWQNNVSSVFLICPQVTGVFMEPFSYAGNDEWELILINRTGAISQNYTGYIAAYSSGFENVPLVEPVLINVTRITNPWVRTWGGVTDDIGYGICCDSSSNIFITGQFLYEVDFDPGPDEDIHTASPAGAFLSKFDQNLNYCWTKTWGNPGDGWCYGIKIINLNDENYIIGQFADTVDFDPGPESEIRTAVGLYDIFLSKFDASGNFIWVNTWGGLKNDWGRGFTYDSDNALYVTGSFHDLVDFDPSNSEDLHSSNGITDVFVTKFTSDGEWIWSVTWGGILDDDGWDITATQSENIFVTGCFNDSVDFNPNEGVDLHTSNGEADIFVSNLILDSNYKWAKTMGGIQTDIGFSITCDNSDNFYLTGSFQDSFDFDPDPVDIQNITSIGSSDFFFSQFKEDGNLNWVTAWGTENLDQPFDITLDNLNHSIYIGGFKNSTFMGHHMYISKFDLNGNMLWDRTWFNNDPEQGQNGQIVESITVNNDGFIFSTGEFRTQNLDFDPGDGEEIRSPFQRECDDIFLLKLNSDGYWY